MKNETVLIHTEKRQMIFFWCVWFLIILFVLQGQTIKNLSTVEKERQPIDSNLIFLSNSNLETPNIKQNQLPSMEWRIQIPKINVNQIIEEGTEQEVLKRSVGHFSQTPDIDGNVCLAAHNKNGGEAGFFRDIKNLNLGDTIYYQKNGIKRKYRVIQNKIIQETDWSLLEPTKENYITLITCEEGLYEYRRCIQAVEEREENL